MTNFKYTLTAKRLASVMDITLKDPSTKPDKNK